MRLHGSVFLNGLTRAEDFFVDVVNFWNVDVIVIRQQDKYDNFYLFNTINLMVLICSTAGIKNTFSKCSQ